MPDGRQPVAAPYDFTSGTPKTFTLQEAGYGYGGTFSVAASNGNVTASVSGMEATKFRGLGSGPIKGRD